MKLIDYLPFIAIMVTLFIGIITCLISFLNYRQSKKTWHVNIASARRKERIDNLIIFYSQMVAMAYPDTIKGYAIKVDYSFVEKIVESYSNLNMLLDHRFPHDTELAYAFKKLTQAAIDYFNSRILSSDCDNLDTEYKKSFHINMTDTDKLCNIFIGVEWTRVKKEVQKGLPIPAREWAEQYKNDTEYYERWDKEYRQ
jgi:hypothetical protein